MLELLLVFAFAVPTLASVTQVSLSRPPVFTTRLQIDTLCSLGDVDGDGTADLGRGSRVVDDGRGQFEVLFMNSDGSVRSNQTLGSNQGGLVGPQNTNDYFGGKAALVGSNLTVSGRPLVAVAAQLDDTEFGSGGALYLFELAQDGTVVSGTETKVTGGLGGFPTGLLNGNALFGPPAAVRGINGSEPVIAVGAPGAAGGGAVFLLWLDYSTTPVVVTQVLEINNTAGGLSEAGGVFSFSGQAITSLGDLDGDGVDELVMGDGGGGHLEVLFLHAGNGTVRATQRLASSVGGVPAVSNSSNFGRVVEAIGDIDGDAVFDLAVSAPDLSQPNAGNVYLMPLLPSGAVKPGSVLQVNTFSHPSLSGLNSFGLAVDFVGDLDPNDGFGVDIAVAAVPAAGDSRLIFISLDPLFTPTTGTTATTGTTGTTGTTATTGLAPTTGTTLVATTAFPPTHTTGTTRTTGVAATTGTGLPQTTTGTTDGGAVTAPSNPSPASPSAANDDDASSADGGNLLTQDWFWGMVGVLLALVVACTTFVGFLWRKRRLCFDKGDGFPSWVPDDAKIFGVRAEKELGEGAFGKVYRGTWDGSKVAIKTLGDGGGASGTAGSAASRSGSAAGAAAAAEDILQEVNTMRPLDSQYVVAAYGLCMVTPGGGSHVVGLAMELCDGGALDSKLAKHGHDLSRLDLATIAHDMAAGLAHLHEHGVVHRDLACRNVLLVRNTKSSTSLGQSAHFRAKLADFGLARELEDQQDYYRATNSPSPLRWSAPETLESSKVTPKSDAYMLGMTLHELYSLGTIPFADLSNASATAAILGGQRMPRPTAAKCPDATWGLIQKLWETDPEARPSTLRASKRLASVVKEIGAADDSSSSSGSASDSTADPDAAAYASTPVPLAPAVTQNPPTPAVRYSHMHSGSDSDSSASSSSDASSFSSGTISDSS